MSNRYRAYEKLLRGMIMMATAIYEMIFDDTPPKMVHLSYEPEPQRTIKPTIQRVNGQ